MMMTTWEVREDASGRYEVAQEAGDLVDHDLEPDEAVGAVREQASLEDDWVRVIRHDGDLYEVPADTFDEVDLI